MITENDKKEIRKMIDDAMKRSMDIQAKKTDEEIKKAIHKAVEYQTKKRGDTPTDDLQLTPRKYINMNGSVAGRPMASTASVGQKFFASDTNIPMWFTIQKTWVNGVGSVVANN